MMLYHLWSLHIAKWDLIFVNSMHAVVQYPEVLLRNSQVKNKRKGKKRKIFTNMCEWTKQANLHGPKVFLR